MSEKPRRWFQIHLSTAIVLMFVAGGMMWMNFLTSHTIWVDSLGTGNVMDYYQYGWPCSFLLCSDYTEKSAHSEDEVAVAQQQLSCEKNSIRKPAYRDWSYQTLALDTATWIGVLVAITCSMEALIRRREARKP